MTLVRVLAAWLALTAAAVAQTSPGFLDGSPLCATYPNPTGCPAPANPLSLNGAFQAKADYPILASALIAPLASPPPIGSNTRNSGAFTTLSVSGLASFTTANFSSTFQVAGNTITWPNAPMTVAALDLPGQVVTGGAVVTALTQASGNITVNCGLRPLQYLTNNGAFSVTSPASDGSCLVMVTNGGGAGAITFSGFSVGSNTGDTLTTTNASKFTVFIWRINGVSGYRIAAHQ